MAKNPPKIRPLTCERFERELAALNRIYNAGHINAKQHKSRYDALLKSYIRWMVNEKARRDHDARSHTGS